MVFVLDCVGVVENCVVRCGQKLWGRSEIWTEGYFLHTAVNLERGILTCIFRDHKITAIQEVSKSSGA